MKKKVRIYESEIKRAVRRGLMENIAENWEMKDTVNPSQYTASPREKEIVGVFGEYGEAIPENVLRYMRKNPKAIIKRLYDVYGQQMFDYISEYSNNENEYDFEEEEVVSEVDTIDVFPGTDQINKIPQKPGQYGIENAEGEISTITVDEVRRLYEAKKKGKCPEDGCVQERSKGWVIISNDTGKCWGRSKKKADSDCTYYDSKKDADAALDAYHANV